MCVCGSVCVCVGWCEGLWASEFKMCKGGWLVKGVSGDCCGGNVVLFVFVLFDSP